MQSQSLSAHISCVSVNGWDCVGCCVWLQYGPALADGCLLWSDMSHGAQTKWQVAHYLRHAQAEPGQWAPYPLPTVDDMYAAMSGCKLWSQLDAVSGFQQVQCHPDDIGRLGFTTPFGNCEWTRMPMGVKGAATSFQSRMDTLLDGVTGAKCYIGDAYTLTQGFKEQLMVLRLVLQRVLDFHLKLNPAFSESSAIFVLPVVCSWASIYMCMASGQSTARSRALWTCVSLALPIGRCAT